MTKKSEKSGIVSTGGKKTAAPKSCIRSKMDDLFGSSTDTVPLNMDREELCLTFSKYRAMIDNIGIGIVLIGKDMKILEMGRQMKLWFPDVNIGDTPLCFKAFNNPPRDNPCDYCPALKTLQDGMVHEAVTQTPSPYGTINFRLTSSPVIGSSGEIVGAIEIVEDVTEKLLMEDKLMQIGRMDAIGRLAGGVAHDFNNTIQIITSAAEFALSDLDSKENVKSYLNDILEAVNSSAQLTKQLLAFGRKQYIQPQRLDLNRTINDSLKILRTLLPENISVDFLEGEAICPIYADPSQLDQILLNLFMNSKDAMPEGGKITISTENAFLDHDDCLDNPKSSPGIFALISVSDTGTGIKSEHLGRIFEPFFTTKTVSRGTGLGLAMVYGIVRQHKGITNVTSDPGKGTTFHVYMPSTNQISIDMREKPSDQSSAGLEGSETILLVEDDLLVRKLLATILVSSGYKVIQAEDGDAAHKILVSQSSSIDLAIIDFILPKVSGKEIGETIIRKWPHIKILFCTGHSANIADTIINKSKNIRILQKPFKKNELLQEVKSMMNKDLSGQRNVNSEFQNS